MWILIYSRKPKRKGAADAEGRREEKDAIESLHPARTACPYTRIAGLMLASSQVKNPLRFSALSVPSRGDLFNSAAAAQDRHHRHAHRDPEGDLRQDHRLAAVGDQGIDFDAAGHRPRMADDRVGLGERELLGGEPVALEELLRRGRERPLH